MEDKPRPQDEPQLTFAEMIPFTSTKILRKLRVGQSALIQEKTKKGKAAGALTQGYASRAKMRVRTQVCLVVSPKRLETIQAVFVTRVE